MKTYSEFRPTTCDTKGLGCEDRQSWLVAPVSQNRDSGALARSNFRVVLKDLGGEGDDVEVHRFGHWGCGWFEVILVRPDTAAAKSAEDWESALSDYPVASDEDFSALEYEDAVATWQNCYNDKERLEYIRANWRQFEACMAKWNEPCEAWRMLLANVRGEDFSGYASELLA